MAEPWLIVLGKIGAMFLVALTGWLARRRAVLSDDTTRALGRFVVDVTFPALTFSQMLRTITRDNLLQSWPILVMGLIVLSVACAAAYGVGRGAVRPGSRSTFVFLAGMPNWIFLPLPIAQALYGDAGVNTVLLFNISTQAFLWTAGVWILRGGLKGSHSMRYLLTNSGLLATFGGMLAAVLFRGAAGWEGSAGPLGSLLQALAMLGGLTVPLSLLVIGAQLAGLPRGGERKGAALGWLLLTRLVVGPALCFFVVRGLVHFGYPLDFESRNVVYLIALMPVAVSCALFIERFGGDSALGAKGIAYSTVASVVTVPLLFALLQSLEKIWEGF